MCVLLSAGDAGGIAGRSGPTALAGTKTWQGLTNDWFTPGNWTPSGVPASTDDVVIAASGSIVAVTNSTTIASLTLSNDAGSVYLVFSNWNTALTVTNNIVVQTNGIITCFGPFTTDEGASNRVYLICSNNLTVAAGGQINVDYKGYSGNRFPAPTMAMVQALAINTEGEHMAALADILVSRHTVPMPLRRRQEVRAGELTYMHRSWWRGDSVQVSGMVTVNGTITANGNSVRPDWFYDGPGSGGGIYITCNRFGGSNGRVAANGGLARAGGGGGDVSQLFTTRTRRIR